MTRPARFPSPHSCWESPTLSHSNCSLQTLERPPPTNHLTAQHHFCAHTPLFPHTYSPICILRWGDREGWRVLRVGGGGATLPAPSLEKPESTTPPRHFEGGYRPVLNFSSSSFSSSYFPALSHSVSISLHGSDLTPRHASHPGVHHRQCVCGLQHPCRAPDRTGAGHLQTREVRVRP